MDNKPLITKELLKKWDACVDGFKRFNELFPSGASLPEAIEGLVLDGHDSWGKWLFDRCVRHSFYVDFTSRGYMNSGSRNSGDRNSGDWNSGDRNSGDRNSGDRNSGSRNSGDRNSGDWNSGDRNSGDWNSGSSNSGDSNSGDSNSGYRNSGDWNSGDRNSGYFNSKTPDLIFVFNKLTERHAFESALKPNFLFRIETCYWVNEKDMTDDEKAQDVNFYVRGGQLRTREYKEAFKKAWDEADKENRMLITKIPNFDAKIFEEITGINIFE